MPVNSAGAARRTPLEELQAQAWHDAMNAKFFTYVHMLDTVVKKMGARGQGAIVNIVGAGGKVASPIHMPGGAANAALMLVSAGMAACLRTCGCAGECGESWRHSYGAAASLTRMPEPISSRLRPSGPAQ